MQQELSRYLRGCSNDGLVSLAAQIEAAERYSCSLAKVEDEILENELLPARYQRNGESISLAQQRKLFRSSVAVVGCGGLGGYIIEALARLGVGTIVAIDPDVFQEHNLNRQSLCSLDVLGLPKIEVAVARVAKLNPAVTVIPIRTHCSAMNGAELVQDVDVVADALDSISDRLDLAKVCGEKGVPLVHGAIAGWYGQIVTQYPDERTLQNLYENRASSPGVEMRLGNLACTAAVVASIEVAEICKVLLETGTTMRNGMVSLNLYDLAFEKITF